MDKWAAERAAGCCRFRAPSRTLLPHADERNAKFPVEPVTVAVVQENSGLELRDVLGDPLEVRVLQNRHFGRNPRYPPGDSLPTASSLVVISVLTP